MSEDGRASLSTGSPFGHHPRLRMVCPRRGQWVSTEEVCFFPLVLYALRCILTRGYAWCVSVGDRGCVRRRIPPCISCIICGQLHTLCPPHRVAAEQRVSRHCARSRVSHASGGGAPCLTAGDARAERGRTRGQETVLLSDAGSVALQALRESNKYGCCATPPMSEDGRASLSTGSPFGHHPRLRMVCPRRGQWVSTEEVCFFPLVLYALRCILTRGYAWCVSAEKSR